MSAWPQCDNAAVYEPPQAPSLAPSPIEIKARLAAARVREGLPAGESDLEDVLARRASDDPWLQETMFTRAEGEEMDAEFFVDEKVQELLHDDEGVLLRREVGWQNGRRVLTIYLSDDQGDVRRRLVEAVGTDRLSFKPAKFTVEETERKMQAVWDARDELEAAGIQLIGSAAKPSGEISVEFMAADPTTAEQILHERFGKIVEPQWQGGTATHTFRAFSFGSWLCEDEHLTVFYGLPHNGERFGGCQAFETDRAVVVSLQILAPRGWSTLIGGFKPSHATLARDRPPRAPTRAARRDRRLCQPSPASLDSGLATAHQTGSGRPVMTGVRQLRILAGRTSTADGLTEFSFHGASSSLATPRSDA